MTEDLLTPGYLFVLERNYINKVVIHLVPNECIEKINSFKKLHSNTSILNIDEDIKRIVYRFSIARSEMIYAKENEKFIEQIIKQQKIELLRLLIKQGIDGLLNIQNNRNQENQEGQINRGSNTGSKEQRYIPVPNNNQAIRGFRYEREDKDNG